MKTQNLIKALEKLGMKVEVQERYYVSMITNRKEIDCSYYCTDGKKKVQFRDQEGRAICVQCQLIGQSNNYMTDYFPGFFAKTIKQVINHFQR